MESCIIFSESFDIYFRAAVPSGVFFSKKKKKIESKY